jgi:hypothetical protein
MLNIIENKCKKIKDAKMEVPLAKGCYSNLLSIENNEKLSRIEITTMQHVWKNEQPETQFILSAFDYQSYYGDIA